MKIEVGNISVGKNGFDISFSHKTMEKLRNLKGCFALYLDEHFTFCDCGEILEMKENQTVICRCGCQIDYTKEQPTNENR